MPKTRMENNMENNNENRMTVQQLFSADTVPDIASALDALTADRDALESLLTEARYAMERQRDRNEHMERYSRRWERVATYREQLRNRERTALVDALQKLHSDQTPVPLDSEQWQWWLRVAVHAGILAGYPSDVHSLMMHLEDDFGNDTALAIWNSVSASMRTEDGSFPDTVSAEESIVRAWQHYAEHLEHHPSDPRLADGWETIWRTAKRASLCDIFDNLAEVLGVPRFEVTKSGYVTVSGSFSVSVPVSGVLSDDDIDIDIDEIIENLGRYEIDVHDIDTSELEVD